MFSIADMEKIRNELGLRYAMISRETGIPVSTIQKVLSGKTQSPRPEVLSKLRDFFGLYCCGIVADSGSGFGGQNEYRNKLMLREIHEPYYETEAMDEPPVVYEEWPHEKKTGRLYTVKDLESFPDDLRVELIDGELYYLAAPLTVHQRIQMIISAMFFNFVRENNGKCEVFPAGFGVRLDEDEDTLVIPDVTICCKPDKITEKGAEGAPDLVVEILSPSNWKKDSILKFKKYVGAGVREYWMVDPRQRTIQVFRKDKESYCGFYTFDDLVPVGIWDEKLSIRLADHDL